MDESTALGTNGSPPPTSAEEARLQPSPDHAEEDLADVSDDPVPTRSFAMLPMVGLGGSAGGLAALQGFFAAAPTDSGMAFVVVMHLSAEHESALAEILQRSTTMPVRQVQNRAKVEADHVYVIPPGKTLTSIDGHLVCGDLTPYQGRRVAVDLFFRTLADTHGPHAAAIVLSGVDGDGAIGIKRIKERGGLTIAQDPSEAEHSGMPRSAIGTGMVDWILPVADMPAQLKKYSSILGRLKLPPEDGPQPGEPVEKSADGLEAALRDLLTYVRAQTGRDFSYYKRATILRRIGRRMSINGIEDVRAYLDFMRVHTGEAGALLKDLLISVTNFFRDRDAFDALEEHLPALFAGKTSGDELRVWVAACATGEEAYSVAMLLSEHARSLDAPPRLQIFATDLDEDAIRVARDGLYPPAIAADVSDERLRRFFIRDSRGFRIGAEIREAVVFASHDLLKDAPFSRLDLVTCRNLFIYLNPDAQRRALEIIHFALRPRGRLFLGVSESAEVSDHLFRTVDKKHRIFEPRPTRERRVPQLGAESALARVIGPQIDDKALVATNGLALGRNASFFATRPSAEALGVTSWRELHLKLIERFAPASVVVTSEYEIVHLSDRVGRYLHFAAGEPTTNLLLAVDPALTGELRTALLRTKDGDEAIETARLGFSDHDGESVVIRVSRADDLAPGFLLVTFVPQPDAAPVRPVSSTVEDDAYIRTLQQQIDELKWHLRDATEQGNVAAQELKASNEELQAMNEELRSATEELETSREELQSINEELTTVNQELKGKVDELSHANGDLQNLMGATAIATLFLDRGLGISLFTPSAVELFNLIPADVGRPISDLANRLEYPQLTEDANAVLDKLAPVEREVRFEDRWLLARLRPYRSGDDRISGVVLTFVDISDRRRVSDALRESEALFRTIVTQAAAGVVHTAMDGRITLANARFGRLTGRVPEELVGTSIFDLVHPDDRAANQEAFGRLATDGTPFEMEKRFVRSNGDAVWVSSSVTAVLDGEGKPGSAVAIVLDISDRRHAEQALRESEERLRLIVENAREYAILTLDLKRRITGWNIGAESLTGYLADEVIGESGDILFVDEDRSAGAPQREATQALEEGRATDERWHRRKNGSRFWGSGVMMVMRDAEGSQPMGLLKIFRDHTMARAAEQALETSRAELVQALVDNRKARAEAEAASHAKDRFLAILSHELRTPLTPVVMALHALERHTDLPGSLRSTVELIRRNVKAELMLIDDLLDVTRISSGKLEMAREHTDMHEVVHAAADVCANDFQAKRQHLGLALHAAQHVVPGDAARLQQVVWNLLKNASKFTPTEGEIRVVSSNIDNRFVLVVADTGIGISGDALPSIFDAFAQEGPWITSEFGGLGLGLAIAKATVEAHQGTLAAASSGRNQGATFTIELPLD
jgi:two-component system, chemotaxis family, CheB/CheR fusion protein